MMMTTLPPEKRGEDYKRLVRQEELILDVTEGLTEALDRGGVTKAELARRLGRTPGFVSQVLRGGRNLTLRTIADIAGALSLRPSLRLAHEADVVRRVDKPRRSWTLDTALFGVAGGGPVQFTQIPANDARGWPTADRLSWVDGCRLSA